MKKILLLEDEEMIGKLYAKKLTEAGFEVLHALTPEAIEKMAETFSADIVLLDHGISGSSRTGSDCIPTMRALLPHAKIIILSNYPKDQIVSQLSDKKYYADDYFLKINTPPKKIVEEIEALGEKNE